MEKIFGLKGGGTINEGGCRQNSWVSKEDEAAVCRQQPRIPGKRKRNLWLCDSGGYPGAEAGKRGLVFYVSTGIVDRLFLIDFYNI